MTILLSNSETKRRNYIEQGTGSADTALTLVIIGAVNWGLIGIFKLDLVNLIFGNMTWMSRVIYTLIGISGLYLLSLYGRVMDFESENV